MNTQYQRFVRYTQQTADEIDRARDRTYYDGFAHYAPVAFSHNYLRMLRAAGTRLKLAKTEAEIQPNGGEGPVRCYSGRQAVGTPYVADSGQIMAELLWMDNDEAISADIEVLLAFFPDLKQTDGTVGAVLNADNTDYITVPSTLTSDIVLGENYVSFTFTKSEDNPVSIYDMIFSCGSGAGKQFQMRFDRSTNGGAGSLQLFYGGTTTGQQRADFSLTAAATGITDFVWKDSTPHQYIIYFNGILPPTAGGKVYFYIDGTEHTNSPQNLQGVGASSLTWAIGRGNTTANLCHGTIRDFSFIQVNDATQRVFYPMWETGSSSSVEDVSGNGYDGTLNSSDATAVWALNTGAGKSGWLIIGADCETPVNQTGAAP